MLRLPRFRMVEPTTWTEAAALLREHGAAASDIASGTPNVPVMLVAGGTDLFPNMKRRQFTPQVLVSLGRVKGAREISNGSGMRIAAGATLTEVAAHPTVCSKYTALAQAAGAVSTPQLRNMGTIGGNLCLDTLGKRDNRGVTKDRIGPSGLGDGKVDPKRAMRRLAASTDARERKKTGTPAD